MRWIEQWSSSWSCFTFLKSRRLLGIFLDQWHSRHCHFVGVAHGHKGHPFWGFDDVKVCSHCRCISLLPTKKWTRRKLNDFYVRRQLFQLLLKIPWMTLVPKPHPLFASLSSLCRNVAQLDMLEQLLTDTQTHTQPKNRANLISRWFRAESTS